MPAKKKAPAKRKTVTTSRRATRKVQPTARKKAKVLQRNLVTAEGRAEKELTALARRLGIDTGEVARYVKKWNRVLDKELKTASRQIDGGIEEIRTLVRREQRTASRMLDDAVQRALGALNIPTRQEIQALTRKVAQLSRKIDRFEG